MKPQLFALHYLFTKKQGKVAAHCLDLDLVAVGKTEEIAEYRLNMIVRAKFALAFRSNNPAANLLFAAPPEFWAQLRQAKPLPTATLKIETPPMVVSVQQAIVVEMPVLRSEVLVAA
jgi:hypothetical protein